VVSARVDKFAHALFFANEPNRNSLRHQGVAKTTAVPSWTVALARS